MLDVKRIISRADEFTIQKILDPQVIKITQLIDSNFSKTSEMKKLIFTTIEEREFLNDKTLRSVLIDLLREDEVRMIAETLGFLNSNITNHYEFLKKKKMKRHSGDELIFYNFFNLSPPMIEKNSKAGVLNSSLSPLLSNYQLFKHQRKAVEDIKEKLSRYPHRVLLHMPTGSGKTRTSMSLICDYLRENDPFLIVWLASTEELCSQAYNEFEKAWSNLGNREIGIGKLWGDSNIANLYEVRDGLIVAGFQKLTYLLNTSEGLRKLSNIAKNVSFVVVDEAHQSIAERYQSVIEILFNSNVKTRLLGLSATPGRTWNDVGEDQKLADYFNGQKVTLQVDGYENPVEYLIDNEYIATVEYRNLEYENSAELAEYFNEKSLENTKDFSKEVLSLLGQDSNRNLKIIREITRLSKIHKRILVFAPSVESSEIISQILQIEGFKINSITSETESEFRKQVINDFKENDNEVKVICNYGVLTTGFDAPSTSAALIARPTLSLVLYSQMVGRAIRGRKAGGNLTAEIVTVVDTELPGFRSVADAFYNWEDVWNE
ncbi:MAG: DEAD/DEAH box helicase [Bacillota bacterium]